MYYYIFDIKKCKKRSQVESIKNYLGILGISGEFVIPDRIRSGRELAEQGVFKGYSTIVAIGSDDLIDDVAAVMLAKQQAFGVIPLGASENIQKTIGANNWEDAATNLRYRKVTDTRVGIINEQHVFFSYCELLLDRPASITVEFEEFMIQAKAKEFYVANKFPGFAKKDPEKLDVILRSVDPGSGSVWNKLKKALGGSTINQAIDTTLIRSNGLRVFSPRQITILVDGRPFVKTPATFGVSQKTLRLVTKRNSS